jgi:tRNA(Arg) A34 adenosine deaminase TadA
VSTFAECSVIKPSADERWLCIPTPPGKRPNTNFYAWSTTSPINVRPPGGSEFDSQVNRLATNFALRAIEAQPAAYLRAVWNSTAENFQPQLEDSAAWYSERRYTFPAATPESLKALASANQELPYYLDGYIYNGGRDPSTQIVPPFAGWIRAYQRLVVLPGPLLGLIVLAGLAGIAMAWRRLGGPAQLPWLTGVVLIVVPAATTDYSARYLLASIPAFCIAGAIGVRQISDWVRHRDRRAVRRRRSFGLPLAERGIMPAHLDEADRRYLQRAIDISRRALDDEGKTPFGALVVVDDKVVGEGTSRVVELSDPSAHAEIMALRDAGTTLGRHLLEDAVMYASSEPCPMCLIACYWARLPRVVYGATSHDVATYGVRGLAVLPRDHPPK